MVLFGVAPALHFSRVSILIFVTSIFICDGRSAAASELAMHRIHFTAGYRAGIYPALPSLNHYASDEWLAGCAVCKQRLLVGCTFVTAATAVTAAASNASNIEPRPWPRPTRLSCMLWHAYFALLGPLLSLGNTLVMSWVRSVV